MAFISVRDAARRLSVDERTIRRWIEAGTLAASQGVNGRMVISEDEIARASQDLQRAETPAQDLGERLAAIEERLTHLETLLAEQLYKQIAPPVHVLREPRAPAPALQPALIELPGGTIPLAEFADSLGITRTTVMGHLAQGHYQDTRISGKHHFTAEQAEQARAYHVTHPQRGKR